MQYIKLGKSDINISRIIFGAWAIGGWYWGGSQDQESQQAIDAALDHGITTFDTAPMYGFGHSETVLGQALRNKRTKVQIATKCGLRWDQEEGVYYFTVDQGPANKPVKIYRNLKAKSIRLECELSLKRLQTDYIDLYQCHWPDKSTAIEETAETMLRLQEEGKIRAIGVSNFSPSMMADFAKIAPLVSDQPKYNLLDRKIEKDVLPYALKNKIALIVYSPLAQGLLTGKVTPKRKFPENDYRKNQERFQAPFLEKIQPAVEILQRIAQKNNTTAGNIAQAWLLAQPGITASITGIRNAQQAQENSEAANLAMETTDISKITETFNQI